MAHSKQTLQALKVIYVDTLCGGFLEFLRSGPNPKPKVAKTDAGAGVPGGTT